MEANQEQQQVKPRPKQVIVMRTDLGMRKGKMMAQAAHASMMFLLPTLGIETIHGRHITNGADLPQEQYEWLTGEYAKICVGIGSEEEMISLLKTAQNQSLTVHMVTDNGHTEFGGVKTNTCICIGPHYPEVFVGLTDHLKLL